MKWSAKRIIVALMTNRNKPKVIIVMGNVKITIIGLTIKFNKLKATATIIAVV